MSSLVFHLVTRGVIWNTIRGIFGVLDVVVFTLFSWGMGLLLDITMITSKSDLSTFYDDIHSRIYLIMAVFMLFKIMVSMLTYVVNPDNITDKSQGAGKLVIRIIVSLIMLMAFPTVFKELNNIQAAVVQDGTIQKVVLGSESVDTMGNMANNIAMSSYNGIFFTENDGSAVESVEGVSDARSLTISDLIEHVNDPVEGNRYAYQYTYMPVAGTIVGIIMTFLVFGMCIDIAIRVFKLIILQLVAPIPILSYIDPKQSKDGTFSKWLKMLISTWLEIFIKLFIIYFVVMLMDKLVNGGIASLEGSALVKIVLIIGLFFFAKDAPKFICDAIGIKAPEKGGIGSMLGKAALGSVAGFGIGAAAGLVSGGLGGMAAGALNGMNAGFHGTKVGDTLKQGLDLGTQVRTGGEQAKYKNLIQKAQEKSMQHSAARKLGYGSISKANKDWADLKAIKNSTADTYNEALSAYQANASYTYGGKTYSGENLRKLIYGYQGADGKQVDGLKIKAAKAESKFNDVSSHLAVYGMGSKEKSSLENATEAEQFFDKKSYLIDASKFTADAPISSGPAPSSSPAPSSRPATNTGPAPSTGPATNTGPTQTDINAAANATGDFYDNMFDNQRNG